MSTGLFEKIKSIVSSENINIKHTTENSELIFISPTFIKLLKLRTLKIKRLEIHTYSYKQVSKKPIALIIDNKVILAGDIVNESQAETTF